MSFLEVKKMKQGMSYTCKEKTLILNVFKYFRNEFPQLCVTEIVRRTSKATGCSEKSIFLFRKEEKSGGFKSPSTTKIRRNININSRAVKYDNTVREAIKNIIYDLKYKNITPSLNTILKRINEDSHLPNFSLMTLRRLLFDMGFSYEKQGNKSVLVEKPLVKKEVKHDKPKVKKAQAAPQNQVNTVDNTTKPGPQVPQNNLTMLPNHLINTQQSHRLLPMPMPQHDNNYMMPNVHMPHHNMSMMLNHRIPPPHLVSSSNLNMTPTNVSLNMTQSHPANVTLNMAHHLPPSNLRHEVWHHAHAHPSSLKHE